MTQPLEIRAATRDDVPTLLELVRALAEYERLTHLVAADERELARELFGPASHVEAVLGFAGGAAVGFAVYFHNFSTFLGRRGLYLEDLFVRPEHRRRGYGRALLLHVARLAHARGCGRFEWMALDWNEPAIRFYKSLGAAELAEWRLFRVTGDALARLAAME
ncbi:MAG: GNAT family N-acetyltransferase [Burkholderiales bacterium]